MSGPSGVYSDGTRLFVADSQNNRVLIYNTIPTTNGAAASVAVGQTNMTSSGYGTSATAMSWPSGVYSNGTRLFVVDENNSRVLIYNTIPITNGTAANVAVGQTNMTSGVYGTSATVMYGPSGVYSNGTRLFVADTNNGRVLIYNKISTTNGAAADIVVGQPDMTSSAYGTSATLMAGPTGIYSDGTRLFVVDENNSRVLIYNTIPTTNGAAANVVVGQPNMTSSAYGTSATAMSWPSGVYSDGTRLLVADGNNRVLIYNTIPTTNGAAANIVVGQPDMTSSSYGTSATLMAGPVGVYSDGTRLFVADYTDSRVLIYNKIPTTNGAAADVVVGQPDMTSSAYGTSATAMHYPSGVYSDGTRLFVADSQNNRVLIYNTIPTTNGAAADVVVGQTNMTSSAYGTSVTAMSGPSGVYSDGTRLFVADGDNNRVLIYNTIPTTNGAAAEIHYFQRPRDQRPPDERARRRLLQRHSPLRHRLEQQPRPDL
jgi:sugar lactone lactonase YvrE